LREQFEDHSGILYEIWEIDMDKKLLELAVDLVEAQATGNKMAGEEMESSLLRVYNALFLIREAEREGRPVDVVGSDEQVNASAEWAQDLEPRASIQEDRVVCLECGAEFRQLTANHLRTHKITPREYKKKWGFPLKQPLSARNLTILRSRSAKKRGLPSKLQQYHEDQRKKKQSAAAD